MNRKTLIALAAFAALAVIALFALRQPEKGERAADRSRPIARLNAGDVGSLSVTRGGATTVITKEGDKYKVTAPVAYAADDAAAKAAFEAIEKLDLTDIVTDQKAKHAEFEVDDAKAVHVVAKGKQGGQVLADLLVGKTVGNGTMVRPAGKDEVWQASGGLRFTVDKSPADWRDKTVTTFTAGDAEKLEVKAKDGAKIALKKTGTKEGSEDKWEVTDSSVKVEKLDNSIPNGIVSALATFKANDFADDAKPADSGLDAPALTVTVGLKGGKSATVLVGNKKGEDDFYVKTPEKPTVFLAKKFNIERINQRPNNFRDKTLCDLADSDLTEISVSGDKAYTLVKSGNDWKATKPPKLELDTAKASPIASAFREWRAAGFAEDQSPKANGLAKPQAVITAKAKAGKGTCTVKIGDATKDGGSYYAQTAKGPDVYLVAKWSADRILVKPDDLKKSGTATNAMPHP